MAWAAGMALAAGLAGAASAHDIQTYEFAGTVGAKPVGASLTIVDNQSFDVGHYFYDSDLTNIPLKGHVDGRTVTLGEPGGGVFTLTLQGDAGAAADGSSFRTSMKLTGTWAQGAQILPVTLTLSWEYAGAPNGHLYATVTHASDAAFEAMAAKFLKAVLAGDKRTAAEAVHFPLRVNGPGDRRQPTFSTPAAVIARWDAIFTPKLLDQIRTAAPHEMFVRNGEASVSNGAVWFDARGVDAINLP
jgi:hypothetical protein